MDLWNYKGDQDHLPSGSVAATSRYRNSVIPLALLLGIYVGPLSISIKYEHAFPRLSACLIPGYQEAMSSSAQEIAAIILNSLFCHFSWSHPGITHHRTSPSQNALRIVLELFPVEYFWDIRLNFSLRDWDFFGRVDYFDRLNWWFFNW